MPLHSWSEIITNTLNSNPLAGQYRSVTTPLYTLMSVTVSHELAADIEANHGVVTITYERFNEGAPTSYKVVERVTREHDVELSLRQLSAEEIEAIRDAPPEEDYSDMPGMTVQEIIEKWKGKA